MNVDRPIVDRPIPPAAPRAFLGAAWRAFLAALALLSLLALLALAAAPGHAQAAAGAFDPSKVTARAAYSPASAPWGARTTLTLTLANGNTPSTAASSQAIVTAPVLSFTDASGAAWSAAAPPVSVTMIGDPVDHKAHGVSATFKLPGYLVPTLPAGATSVDNGNGTQTVTLPFPDVEGGQSSDQSLSLLLDRSKVPAPAPALPPAPAPAP